ncbi:uncharacterized protein LOC144878457 [Branchiostoma floridae x Branchiostoma japonicum]
MEGQGDCTNQEGGVTGNNKISTEDLVVTQDSVGAVSELDQTSAIQTGQEQPTTEGIASVSAHRPQINDTSENNFTNIQDLDSHTVEESAKSQDSAENPQSLKLHSTPDKGGEVIPGTDSNGQSVNAMLAEGYGKPTASRDSSSSNDMDSKDNALIDDKKHPATDPYNISEQTTDLKDISQTEQIMPNDQKKSDNASLPLVQAKCTEGSNPYPVDCAKETHLGIDPKANVLSEATMAQSSVSSKENVTHHTEIAIDCHEIVLNTATTEDVTESSVSDEEDGIRMESVHQSPAELNRRVEESYEATESKVNAGEMIQSSKQDTTSSIDLVGGKNSVKGDSIEHDVPGELINKISTNLQKELSKQTVNNQHETSYQQEEILPTCKEGSEENNKGECKQNVIAGGQNETEEEETMMFSEKGMTAEELADISEFDSTVENVAENVTLNSVTDIETSEGQMDNLTFEIATEDGDPESAESSLEAPTCHLDLGLPTLEMPLGENRISVYSDGDDSQESLKKVGQEDELDKDAVPSGKDIKNKKGEENLESSCKENVDILHVPASSTEDPNKDVNVNYGTIAEGANCKEAESVAEHLTESGGDSKNEPCNSNMITPSDRNQTKGEMIDNSPIEESIFSSDETSAPLDLTSAMKGAKGNDQEASSAPRPYKGRSIWDAVKPIENNFQNKKEAVLQQKTEATEIIQFWKKKFQCKYCSYHAQSEADIKHHTQQKHAKTQEKEKGKELPGEKDGTETEKEERKPAQQDQTFLKLVIPIVKKQKIFTKESKGEEGCEEEKELHDKDKDALSTTADAHKKEKEKTDWYKCTHCSYQSNSVKGLCGHMAVHAKRFKCQKCDFAGKTVKDLQRHMIKVHRSSNSDLLEAKKRSPVKRGAETSSKVLGKQALTHKARKSMSPPAKPKNVIFNNVESVTEEQDVDVSRVFVNHKTYPNGCTYCPYTSNSMPELQAHMEHHQATTGLPCTFCSYKAEDKSTLMSHMEVHYAGFAYKCNHCGHLSPTQEQALQHFDSVCQSKPKPKTSSPSKKQRTKEASPSKGQKHLNSKNKLDSQSESAQDSGEASDDSDILTILQEPPKYSYQCPHCPFTVTGKAKLNQHIAGHSKEEGHKCDLCSYRATTTAKLSKHLRVHQLIGRFKCKHCRFWSVYKDRVKQHLQTECKLKGSGKEGKSVVKVQQKETGNLWISSVDETNSDIVSMVKDPNQYSHRCPHCPFSSASPTQIESHIAQHFREEGAQCDECTFWAISDGMLRKHKRVHQKLGKYKCKYCTYWSWYREKVQTHLEKCKLNPGRTATEEETVEPDSTAKEKEKTENKAKRESYSRWDDSDDEDIIVKVKKTLRTGHKCPHCPFVASNVGKLSIHLPNHDRADGVKCHKCNFRASSEQLLSFHKRVHQRGVRTYHCVHCSFWSWYKDRVKKHLEGGCQEKKKEKSSGNEENTSEKRSKKDSATKPAKNESVVNEEMCTSKIDTDADLGELTEETSSASLKPIVQMEGEEKIPKQKREEIGENLDDIIKIEQGLEPKYGLKCPHCPLTTASADSYQQHLKRHESKEGIKCTKCSFKALTAGRLQVHKKVHFRKFIYQCRHCTFIGESKEEVVEHLENCAKKVKRDLEARDKKEADEVVVSRGYRQYSMNCPHCPYTTGNAKCMKAHQQRHMNQDGIQCERCSFNALSPGKMAKHMKVHQTGGGFKCKYCMFFSSYRGHVLQHLKVCKDRASTVKKKTIGDDDIVGTSEEVGKGQSNVPESLHDAVEKDEIGPYSEVEVLKPNNMSNHKYNCPYCPHSALSSATLETHVQRHFINDGPKCKFCTYRALNASGLYGHERLHWRGCFKCKYCAYIAPHRRRVLEHLAECPGKRILSGTAKDTTDKDRRDVLEILTDTNILSQVEEGKGQKRKDPDPVEVSDKDVMIAYKKQIVKQHKCPHCPYSASGPALLEPHVVRHSDTGSGFKCDLCNYRAASFGWLNNHRKVHQDGHFFKCKYCAYWSPVKDEVLSHVAKKHHVSSEEKKMKVEGPLTVEAAVGASQATSTAGRAAAPSLMDTVKRLGEALRSSPVPMASDAQTKTDVDAALLSPDKTTQGALKRKEGADRNLVVTLKKTKTENGEAIWQTEESKGCPYKDCKKRVESASAFVAHLAEHSGAALTPNTSGQLPQTTQQPSVQTVQQPSIPQQQVPSQQPLPAAQRPQPLLQQAGPALLRHPSILQQQQQLAMFQPQQTLLQQPQQTLLQQPPQPLLQQPQQTLLQQPPQPLLNSLQLMPANPTAPAGLVKPPENIGANQPAVLSQGQAANPQNRQVFLVSGLQQNLGGFALFVPYTSGAQSSPQVVGGSVVTAGVQNPQPTQASSVSQSPAGSPNLPSPQTLSAQVASRPLSVDSEFDLSNHVTQTWRGDYLCKYCSYATQHRSVMSSHVRKHLHSSVDQGLEDDQGTKNPTESRILQRTTSTPSSEGQSVGRLSVSPAFSNSTPPPTTPPHFNLSQHITQDWRSGVINCNYCQFSTTAKNIMSRHVKKHLPQVAASNRATPDTPGSPVGQQGAEGQVGTVDAAGSVAGSPAAFDLSQHATQTWRGDYTCNHCGYVAQFKQIMSRHVKQHLQPGKAAKALMTFQDLTDHIQQTNLAGRALFLCKYCDYQASFKSHVSRHVKKHLALGIPPIETTAQPSISVSPAASAVQIQQQSPAASSVQSPQQSPAANTLQSQPQVSVVPETNSSSGGSRGASPGNPTGGTSSPPPDSNIAGVDVEGRWWTTKFRCKHCSFSTRFKHQIEEHMQTHSPPKAEQGQQLSPGTMLSHGPSHNIPTPPAAVHPPYSTVSPSLQTSTVNPSPQTPSSQISGVVNSLPNAVVSSASSTVTSPPPPAVVVSPPPLPTSPLSGLPATSSAQGAAVADTTTSGKVSMTRRFVYYQCKFCNFTGERKEEITKHAAEVHPGQTPPLTNQGTPYKCPLCHYYTQSNSALQVHIKRHNNRDFPYICTHCKFAGASQEDLEEHSRKHMSMGRGSGRIRNVYFAIFKCPYCTFTSRVSTLMQGHLTTWHSSDSVFRFCFKCDMEFSTNEDMERHMHLYHGGRATLRYDMYKRDSPTSASPAVSSEGSQGNDSEPIPLLWKSSNRQAVQNLEEPLSLVSTDSRAEVGRSPPAQSVSQADDSDVEFVSETPATNSSSDTHIEQSKKEEDVATRGGVSNDGGVVSSSQQNVQQTHVAEDSSHEREHSSPLTRRQPSVSGLDDDDDDVMASPPSSPDLKAVTDLMEELSDSEIISEDSTDPFGHHHSSQHEISPLKASSSAISGTPAEAAVEKTSQEVTNMNSGSLGNTHGEQDNTDTGGRDAEKSDTAGGALMVSRVHPFQSGLVGSVEPATRSSLPGQQNWPALKGPSTDFPASGSSTQNDSEVGRQVKGTALVACVSVSPQTNPSVSGNSRSDSEAQMGATPAGYRCNHCGVRFGDFLMYSIHGGFHHQENPFTCNICKQPATDRYQFNLHFTSAKHASLMDSSPLGAMAASLGVLSRGAGASNTTPAQPDADQGYHCIHCNMTFDDFLLYSIHSGFHSQQHPFMCNICGQDCEDRFQFVMHFAKSDHS